GGASIAVSVRPKAMVSSAECVVVSCVMQADAWHRPDQYSESDARSVLRQTKLYAARCRKCCRLQSKNRAFGNTIQRRPQTAMVFIFQCEEAERLQHAGRRLALGTEHFSHTVDGAGLRLKCDFDEVALRQ